MDSASERPDRAGVPSGLAERLRYARWTLLAAGTVLLALAWRGSLSAAEVAVGVAVLFLAALLPTGKRAVTATPLPGVEAGRGPGDLSPLIEALPDATYLLDRRGTVMFGNRQAIALHGELRPGELFSLRVRVPELIEAIRQSAADGKAREVEFAERFPGERRLKVHLAPVFAAPESHRPSEQDFIVLSFRDLTQQHLVEQMRVDFVANASHELRTPLASLSGFIDTLRGSARDDAEARQEFLGIMAEQAGRMSRLIDDLLSLSRIELNAHVRPSGAADLVPILKQVRDALGPLASERGVALELSLSDETIEVTGDRDELYRVFENLVENALKYGASGKRVVVRATSEPGEASISVQDFGPGIAPEHLPRLTERFYRVDVEASRAQGGTGLGLAIVKHIVARHRGRLSIDSEQGRGSIFTVRMERAGEKPSPAN